MSALSYSRLLAERSEWNNVVGDASEEFVASVSAETSARWLLGPGVDGVEGSFIAKAIDRDVVAIGCFQKESANHIVRNRVHPKFAFYHVGREPSQDI